MDKLDLFKRGNFALHSGGKSNWIIDCEALTEEELQTLAVMALERIPKFGATVGIPNGGLRFSKVMDKYCTPDETTLLIVDDVLTTGGSMRLKHEKFLCLGTYTNIIGLVIFARSTPDPWVHAIFRVY